MRLALASAALLLASSASAQINVEPFRKKLREEGFSGGVEASVTGRFGNNQGVIASGVGQIGWASARHLGFLHARGDYTHLNGRTQIARSFAHARYNLTFVENRLWGELFAQTQSDAFLSLRHRELYGVGPRTSVLSEGALRVFAGLALMFEHERVDVPRGAADPAVTNVWRASSYVAMTLTSDPRVTLSLTAFLQPRVDRLRDRRVLVEALLQIDVGKGFNVRIYAMARHDTEPVTGIKRADGELRNAIAWTF